MIEPNYNKILQVKVDYYSETKAAYEFAAMDYAIEYHKWRTEQNHLAFIEELRIIWKLI